MPGILSSYTCRIHYKDTNPSGAQAPDFYFYDKIIPWAHFTSLQPPSAILKI